MSENEQLPTQVPTEPIPEKTARKRAEELMANTTDGKLVADIFAEAMAKQYVIHGKSMESWRKYFHVRIPEDADPAQMQRVAARLANLFHEATFYYSLAEAQLDALEAGDVKTFTASFNQQVAEWKLSNPGKSLPSQKTLEIQANARVMDIKGAIANARIAKNFWKRVIESLTEVRKNLEIVSKGLYFQSRLEPGLGNPSHMPRKTVFGSEDNSLDDEQL